ncbi:MAG: hypothetical protein KDC34_08535 [Saprospiraceae bacterium]|nr:hypothetical protein [Saprospiraceae bacterium]
MPKLTLYHGSRAKFDRLSNAHHYSGHGRMRAGWGIYLTSDINCAFNFACGNPMALSMVWVVDGKRMYSGLINWDTQFELDKDSWATYLSTADTYRNKNWKEELVIALRDLFEQDCYWLEPMSQRMRDKQYEILLRRIERAKEVRLALKERAYIYQIEVEVPKILDNTVEIPNAMRQEINSRLHHEKRKFQLVERPPVGKEKFRLYDLLEYHFERRYQYARPKKDPARLTSLFLHRLGYDLIKTNLLADEYLLVDISKARIVGVEEY